MTSAVVVTYRSPAGFLDSVDAWLAQVDELLVVDNGSTAEWRNSVCAVHHETSKRVQFLFNEENLGIAAALNLGFASLIERGVECAFVFDQDSIPAPGMIAEIIDLYEHHQASGRVAIVAPNITVPSAKTGMRFPAAQGRFLFRRASCAGQRSLDDVSVVISSGALYDLRAFERIGPFREDFFIDYVDTDYCLRGLQQGYRIIVACKARLEHKLGDQKEARIGPLMMHPTFHSPVRWYYMSRNRVPMLLSYAPRWPHWFLYELVINSYGLVRLLLFEDQKLKKALAIVLGTWDGFAHRMGPISNARSAALTTAKADG